MKTLAYIIIFLVDAAIYQTDHPTKCSNMNHLVQALEADGKQVDYARCIYTSAPTTSPKPQPRKE